VRLCVDDGLLQRIRAQGTRRGGARLELWQWRSGGHEATGAMSVPKWR
jgi:hypothetical protein